MPCPSCHEPVAGNARFCPKCGHRFTHPFVAGLAVLFGLCAVLFMIQLYQSPQSKPSAVPKTPQQIEDENYESAAGACMLWAEKNGPLVMGDFVDDYQLPRYKKDPKDVYRAGLHYRAKPSGLLMRADCSVLHMKDGRLMILEARAHPGQ